MNYSRTQFYNLMEAVEDQGGDHLDRVCSPTTYKFEQFRPIPDPEDEEKTIFKKHDKPKAIPFPSCGHSALFEVPFLDDPDKIVTVCAVEDSMGLWPRFVDQVAG